MNHKEIINEEFKKQAKFFDKKGITLTNKQYLEWIIQSIPLSDTQTVLDVATGTGVLARSISKHVSKVIAIDTLDNLNIAKVEIEKLNIDNIELKEGTAENLPFEDNYFDMVISRLAVHHFQNPEICIKEMKRVCKESNLVAIIDLFSPVDLNLKDVYNKFEKLRDPSHAMALNKEDLADLMKKNDLKIVFEDYVEIEVDLEKWMKTTKTSSEIKQKIRIAIKDDFDGIQQTGLFPFFKNSQIKFKQTWGIIIGQK